MPRLIKTMPKPRQNKPPTPDSKYPWDEWLDGKLRRFIPGKDYQCSTDSFEVSARRQAAKRKLSLSFIREWADQDFVSGRGTRPVFNRVLAVCIKSYPQGTTPNSRLKPKTLPNGRPTRARAS